MPIYRIHRMKPNPREAFRWAAHTGGTAVVKERDYEAGEEVEAATPYAAWKQLGLTVFPLEPGDLLQDAAHKLLILKYIGFEPAEWFRPEPKPEFLPAAVATSLPVGTQADVSNT
jgi:hypothetical protein